MGAPLPQHASHFRKGGATWPRMVGMTFFWRFSSFVCIPWPLGFGLSLFSKNKIVSGGCIEVPCYDRGIIIASKQKSCLACVGNLRHLSKLRATSWILMSVSPCIMTPHGHLHIALHEGTWHSVQLLKQHLLPNIGTPWRLMVPRRFLRYLMATHGVARHSVQPRGNRGYLSNTSLALRKNTPGGFMAVSCHLLPPQCDA